MSNMPVPSGAIYGTLDLEIMRGFANRKTVELRDKPFTLKNKSTSHVYVYGRSDITLDADLAWLVGRKIAQTVKTLMVPDKKPCLIGLPTAGTPLAASASSVDKAENITGRKAVWDQMREVKKLSYGNHPTWVVGPPLPALYQYFIPDNNVTDGGTKLQMHERFREDGFLVDDLEYLIMIDRDQGAVPQLAAKGLRRVTVIYKLLDITYSFGQLGLWNPEQVERVEREIKGQQF